jgi:hypothetical protein
VEFWLKFPADWAIVRVQTRLSARVAVTVPAGGEMSGLTAHFLFAENFADSEDIFPGFGIKLDNFLWVNPVEVWPPGRLPDER